MERRIYGRPMWREPRLGVNPLYGLVEAMVRQARKDIERARKLGDRAKWVQRQQAESAERFIREVTAWMS